MRQFCVFLFCLLFLHTLHAQKNNFWQKVVGKTTYDTNYVVSYYNDLHLTLVGISRNNSVKIKDNYTKKQIVLKPNNAFSFGFGIDYKFLTLEVSRTINQISSPNPQKGNTESFGIRAGITGKKYLGSFLLQRNEGLYIDNPRDLDPSWNQSSGVYPYRPDIVTTILFASLYYNFNPSKYSTMASLWQIDKQKKSAGGVLTGITLSSNTIDADTSISVSRSPVPIDPSNKIIATSSSVTGINVGYGYNYIIYNNLFISALAMPGINLQNGSFRDINGRTTVFKTKMGIHGDYRIIAGYNGTNYYYGIHLATYDVSNKIENLININLANTYIRFFIGKRFNTSRE